MVACGASSRESFPDPLTRDLNTLLLGFFAGIMCFLPNSLEQDKVSTGLKRCLSRESTGEWGQEPGSQPGTRGQKRHAPNAMQRADPNGFEPLKTQANTHLEQLFALTSRLFFTFTGRADSLHGLQPISPKAPKAKTVRRICEVISTPNPFCTPFQKRRMSQLW